MGDAIHCGFGEDALDEAARALLRAGTEDVSVTFAREAGWSNLSSAAPDPRMQDATVLFGQPDPEAVLAGKARWVHLTSAGYTRYDTSNVREAFVERGIRLSTSSSVYASPCAEHALAMMLAMGRRLPDLWQDQQEQAWHDLRRRSESTLVAGSSVLILGHGAIARRLIELLAPFNVTVTVVRRTPRAEEGVRVITSADIDEALRAADHVVNTLPGGPATTGYMNAHRIGRMKPTAFFYNVGRGTTVDQQALVAALEASAIGGAYLDVTEPEPLPADHALWRAPRCCITPHAAGGQRLERLELVRHFVNNLERHRRGQPLHDRVL